MKKYILLLLTACLSMAQAQEKIARDWIAAYQAWVPKYSHYLPKGRRERAD